jgi:PIN domain nuclease of toxin-antitoxin system
VLPIGFEHALLAGRLPGPHRDPFDRMLIAQSRKEDLPVVTADRVFAAYDARVIW